MRKITTLLSACLFALLANAQITFTGNNTALSTPNNAPAVTVDNSLVINGGTSFTVAKVTVSTNFNSGDVLGYTGTLPSGVTADYNTTTGVLTFTGSATTTQLQTLLRTVTFRTTSSIAAQRTIVFSLGSAIPNAANGHFYEFIPGSFTWSAAKTDAAGKKLYGLQGYLATITSQAENDFVQQKTAADGWIGGSDDYAVINAETGKTYTAQSQTEGKFIWVTGPEKDQGISNGNTPSTVLNGAYMNWNSGEPNNYNNTNENFIQFFSSGTTAGRWNDLPNTSTLGYVVEYGGMAGDPVVDLTHSRNISLIATALRTSLPNLTYVLKSPSIFVDDNITIYSIANITNATVTISGGFKSGDVLTHGTLPSGVTSTYTASTGVLAFTGTTTPANWQSLLRTVRFNSTSTIIGNRIVSFSVGNLISGSNGHFYEFVTPGVNWTTAKANAAGRTYLGLQGYLATITSQTENDFIQQKLSADGWIGASDDFSQINTAAGVTKYADQAASEGKWHWVTGPEKGLQMTTANTPNSTSLPPVFNSAYNNWNTGEPNNSPSEHVAQIYSTGGVAPGKWNDLSGTSSLGYVVEYGGLSTDPLLELSSSRTILISNVLPVFDLVFDVTGKNGTAQLAWSTEREERTLRFDVMHSTDGRSFTKIGEVAAGQNTTGRSLYSFTHTSPNSGINYYKLVIVDQNGQSTSGNVKHLDLKGKLSISPNPFRQQFSVTSPYRGSATLVVKNAAGAVVLQQKLAQAQTIIQTASLPAGVYFAEVNKEGSRSETIKLIKQ